MIKKFLLSLCACLAVVSAGRGSTVLSDTFSYPNGSLVDVSGSVWTPHSGGGSNPIQVTNSQIAVRGGSGTWEDDNALLAGAPYLQTDPSAVVYSSYTIIISNSAGLPPLTGTYMSHFKGTNTGAATDFGARVFLSTSNTIVPGPTPAGKYRVSIGNGTSANIASGQYDLDLSVGTVYTVVTRFVPSTGIATLWVDPTAEGDTSVTANDTGTVARPNPFDVFAYAFRQASAITVYVDNLKIGTAFNDVVGANTSPTISSIPTQYAPMNGVIGPLAFTVGDAESPASSLTVTADSSNTGLVPTNNIVLAGMDANRTVTITPVTGQQGSTVITLTVSDGVNNSFTTFIVRVGFPTISAIADQAIPTNTVSPPIPFTVNDAETPLSLNVTATSSNPGLVPDGNIVINGTGTSRSLTITPVTDAAGQAVITVSVNDNINTNSTSFFLTVYPHLGLLLGDDFSYPDGWIVTSSGGFWTPHSGTSNDTLIVNNQLFLTQTNVDDVHAFFTNSVSVPTASGVILYSTFKVNFLALPRFNNGGYFAHYKDTGTSNFRARVFALTNGAAPGKFRLGICNGGSIPVAFPQDLNLNTTYTVVTRYNVGSAASSLWVDPAYETSPRVDAIDGTSAIDIWNYDFRQDGLNGGIGVLLLDDLQIGTAFSDVVPFVASPAAEPLNIQQYGGDVVLSWTNALFRLQAAPALNGTYSTILGATSPYTNAAPTDTKFFRLAFP